MFSCWWSEEPNLPHSDPSLSVDRQSLSVSHYLLAGICHIALLIPGLPASSCSCSLGTVLIGTLSSSSFQALGMHWGLPWLHF